MPLPQSHQQQVQQSIAHQQAQQNARILAINPALNYGEHHPFPLDAHAVASRQPAGRNRLARARAFIDETDRWAFQTLPVCLRWVRHGCCNVGHRVDHSRRHRHRSTNPPTCCPPTVIPHRLPSTSTIRSRTRSKRSHRTAIRSYRRATRPR